MMIKLREKSEVWFAVVVILIYVVGNSTADLLSKKLGMEMGVTLVFDLALIAVMMAFIFRNGLAEYYGVCAPKESAGKLLFYLPLILLATVNLWFGICVRKSLVEGIVYFLAMLATGVIEEILFRGFLFRGMAKKNKVTAIIFTSVLFGAGHIVNMINGSGMDRIANICQVFYAISIGFVFAAVLVRAKSLIPCILTHSFFNAFSVFANEPLHLKYQIPICISLCVVSSAAAVYYFAGAKKEAGRFGKE